VSADAGGGAKGGRGGARARVAIHGFGRTGRQAFKAIWRNYRDQLEIAAIGIEDMSEVAAAAHLLHYDSNYGRFNEPVSVVDSELRVGETRIPIVAAKQLASLPWSNLDIGIVIEATGVYVDDRMAEGHLEAGADKVVITAPVEQADLQVIYGVNHGDYDPNRHHVISAGSDTTNALAPVVQVLQGRFHVKNAMMTAVRAYTNAQKLLDSNDLDLRRARSAPTSIVPTTTRATTAIGSVFPDMAGRLGGYAVRVPVSTVSILELTAHLGEAATADQLNAAYRDAAEGPLQGILLPRRHPVRHRRRPAHPCHRQPREGERLVRQRVGLLVARCGRHGPRGARLRRQRQWTSEGVSGSTQSVSAP
jgi:glyceraldehyde 3-phosphate dehydrogenase